MMVQASDKQNEAQNGHPVAVPVEYGWAANGNIILDETCSPFDGDPVVIKLAAGWCEARWEPGRTYMTADGPDGDGFEWVCMDGDFTAELDDAKFWLPIPLESQAKATEGKAGMAGGAHAPVRRSTAGTGLRVGAADAVQPATSEIMDVTAGETAPNSPTVTHTPTPWHPVDDFLEIGRKLIAAGETLMPQGASARFIKLDPLQARHFRALVPILEQRATLVELLEDARNALVSIQVATTDGSICDDVAWFNQGWTLHDYCEAQVSRLDKTLKELRNE